jgi:excisionase family DNA binding protein
MPHNAQCDREEDARMESENLKTEDEAARFLSVSVRTLQAKRWRGDTDLPFVKFGRTVRYRLADLQAYIENNLVHFDNLPHVADELSNALCRAAPGTDMTPRLLNEGTSAFEVRQEEAAE